MTLRPRGRPPLQSAPSKSVNVHLRLSAPQYDATWRQAQAARVTVPQFIRAVLSSATPPAPKAD